MYYLAQGGGGGAQQAFTMAEILLSLTIIGVVAAITLPSLTGNINERTWNTQRKALFARFSQAIALMPALNGYGVDNPDNAAETFVTAGLSKVLKINNICDNEHLADCALPESITTMAASKLDLPLSLAGLNPNNISADVGWTAMNPIADTKAAGFETANGESIVIYYNPSCTKSSYTTYYWSQKHMCANFVFDLNGAKGPNTMGKDVGIITVFYPTDSEVVAPEPVAQDAASSIAAADVRAICKEQDTSYRMPTQLELASMLTNKNLIANMSQPRYWSSSLSVTGSAVGTGGHYSSSHWYLNYQAGIFNSDTNLDNMAVRCVKR